MITLDPLLYTILVIGVSQLGLGFAGLLVPKKSRGDFYTALWAACLVAAIIFYQILIHYRGLGL